MRRVYHNGHGGAFSHPLLADDGSHVFNAGEHQASIRRYDEIFTAADAL